MPDALLMGGRTRNLGHFISTATSVNPLVSVLAGLALRSHSPLSSFISAWGCPFPGLALMALTLPGSQGLGLWLQPSERFNSLVTRVPRERPGRLLSGKFWLKSSPGGLYTHHALEAGTGQGASSAEDMGGPGAGCRLWPSLGSSVWLGNSGQQEPAFLPSPLATTF